MILLNASNSTGNIESYSFSSSLDGVLCNSNNSTCSKVLSEGNHLITLQIKGFNGETSSNSTYISIYKSAEINSTTSTNELNGSSILNSDNNNSSVNIIEQSPKLSLSVLNGDSVSFNTNIFIDGSNNNFGSKVSNIYFQSSLEGNLTCEDKNSSICVANISRVGTHTILMIVRYLDNSSILGSTQLNVINNNSSGSEVESVLKIPDGNYSFSQNIILNGTESIGNITEFVWRSSIDGELNCKTNNSSICETVLSAGNHTIYLIVKNEFGKIDVSNEEILINSDKNKVLFPIINIIPYVDINQSISDNQKIVLDGSSSGGNITRFVWKSSIDGNLCQDSNLSICETFLKSTGQHIISLTVFDKNNNFETIYKIINVKSKLYANLNIQNLSVSNKSFFADEKITMLANDIEGNISQYIFKSSRDGILCDINSTNLRIIETNETNLTEVINNQPLCETSLKTVGKHIITLIVKDKSGELSIDSEEIDILANNKITANLYVSNSNIDENHKIILDGTASLGNIKNYFFVSSQDGNLTCDKNNSSICETKLSVGYHTVSLILYGIDNTTSIKSIELNVTASGFTIPKVIAKLNIDNSRNYLTSDTIIFDASKSLGQITEYQINSSLDGSLCYSTSFVNSVCQRKLSTGTHTISLTVKDKNGYSDTVFTTIKVDSIVTLENNPVASFDILNGLSTTLDNKIFLDGSASSGDRLTYIWKSSLDGNLCQDSNLSICEVKLSQVGTHTITLIVKDKFNIIDLFAKDIIISGNNATKGELTANLLLLSEEKAFVKTDETVTLSAIQSIGNISKYTFKSSHEGILCEGAEPVCEHNFTQIGLHTITLFVENSNGFIDADYLSMIVTSAVNSQDNNLSAILNAPFQYFTVGDIIIFDGSHSIGNIAKYYFISNKDGNLSDCSEVLSICQTNKLSVNNHEIVLLVEDPFGNFAITSQSISITNK